MDQLQDSDAKKDAKRQKTTSKWHKSTIKNTQNDYKEMQNDNNDAQNNQRDTIITVTNKTTKKTSIHLSMDVRHGAVI